MRKRKKLSDYLHLYLGCPFMYGKGLKVWDGWDGFEKSTAYYYTDEQKKMIKMGSHTFHVSEIRLVLRPLSDMTKDENEETKKLYFDFMETQQPGTRDIKMMAHMTQWFLRHNFDLFGLIESGQAINSTKLKV